MDSGIIVNAKQRNPKEGSVRGGVQKRECKEGGVTAAMSVYLAADDVAGTAAAAADETTLMISKDRGHKTGLKEAQTTSR